MFKRDKVYLGITPSCWMNDDMPQLGDGISFEQCVSEMALSGFEGCSVGHKFPADTAVLKVALELRGLRISEPWISTFFTANVMEQRTLRTFTERLRFIKEMGGTSLVVAELGHAVHQQPVAVLPNKPEFSDAQWNALIDGLHKIGEMAAESDMKVCYHPHMGSGIQSRSDVDRLMSSTDDELVHLLLDTGHLYWAGEDPLEMARATPDRIKHVHLKDVRQGVLEESTQLGRSFLESVVAGVFTVPGDGVIDFKPILQVLADHNYEGWLVVEAEQDPGKATPLEYAKKARTHLREVTGM